MKHSVHLPIRCPIVMLLAMALVAASSVAWAQTEDDPVVLSVNVSGNQVPGGRARATVNVEINDGSTVSSIAWSQTGGVSARLINAGGRTVIARLANVARYKEMLLHVLNEPPVGPDQLPPNVPFPEGEFPAGLQNRFQVIGLNGFALEEAALVTLEVEVTTSSGTYHHEAEIHTALPWKPTAGIRNVPVGVPVLLYGKEQDSYAWRLTTPDGSSATLRTPRRRDPEFTPDVAGIYELSVRDQAAGSPYTMEVYAGTWRGVIVSQDISGHPVAEGTCIACHSGILLEDTFADWAQTGHAEAFADGLNTNSHFSSRCFGCHTVGYDPDTDNGGIDEADDYLAFLDSGLFGNPDPGNWTSVLDNFPETAQLTNIQCESCHGPANSEPRLDTLAHGWRAEVEGEPRVSLSSDVCATCHGEPLRHGRFQQWQLSGHANYEVAIDESESGNCSRCHTANGFLAWLPVLTGEVEGDPAASVEVTWSPDESHPQTCVTCHDPHASGTQSGNDNDATVRISGSTPRLIAGFEVVGSGKAAICITCHNSRRGLRNDANFDDVAGTSEAARAPHGSSQTDVLMGENAYFVNVGVRGRHSLIEDSCVTCHMDTTPPPDQLSYNQSGTNHTFFASPDICTECHVGINADGLQTVVDEVLAHLQGAIEEAILDLMADQIAAGNTIDLNGEATLTNVGNVAEIVFGSARGRQAITVVFDGGRIIGPLRMNDVEVVQPAPLGAADLYDFADPSLIKAGWNWNLVNNDGSRGAHNPTYVLSVLDGARDALGIQGGPKASFSW